MYDAPTAKQQLLMICGRPELSCRRFSTRVLTPLKVHAEATKKQNAIRYIHMFKSPTRIFGHCFLGLAERASLALGIDPKAPRELGSRLHNTAAQDCPRDLKFAFINMTSCYNPCRQNTCMHGQLKQSEIQFLSLHEFQICKIFAV